MLWEARMDYEPDSLSRMSSSLFPWSEIRVWFSAHVIEKSLLNPLVVGFSCFVAVETTTATIIMKITHARIMQNAKLFFLDGFFSPCNVS